MRERTLKMMLETDMLKIFKAYQSFERQILLPNFVHRGAQHHQLLLRGRPIRYLEINVMNKTSAWH